MNKPTLLSTFYLFFCLSNLIAQEFILEPKHPQQGSEITIHYNSTGGVLEGREVYSIAYVLELGQPIKAYDLKLVESDRGVSANFEIPENAQAIYFKFENKTGKISDNNKEEGYHTKLYKGDQPVEHADIVYSTIFGSGTDILGIKADWVKAAKAFEKGITSPSERLGEEYLPYYAVIVRMTEDQSGREEIIKHIKTTFAKGNLSEKEMKKLASIARRVKGQDLSKSITEKIKIQFPESRTAVANKYAGFRKIQKFEDQVAMYEEALSSYGDNEDFKSLIDNMERRLAISYGERGEFDNMYKIAERVSSNRTRAGIYNDVAWSCTGDSLEGEGRHLKQGMEISMKSLEVLKEEMETMKDKWDQYSKRQWMNGLKSYYAYYSDTYALLAYKNGDLENALKYQRLACEYPNMKDRERNERYAIFMEKAKGGKVAMEFLEEMISHGDANSNMKQHFAKLYKENVSIDQAYELYLTKLEDKAKDHKIKLIKEEMVNKESPNFSLKNLKGEEISLSSLNGKVVVIDFWATWCGPCKASFPGMQKAVTKYKDADDVAFVFVDTWERGEQKSEKAAKFINSKGYTFNVLMDNENSMAVAYGVQGIPAKFILDKKGNIRFSSSGFKGSDEELVEEISMRVELLR